MTLDKLIEAVEAGTLKPLDLIVLEPSPHALAWKAYNGSLDAAKNLHDALLPGVRVEIFGPTDNWGVRWGGKIGFNAVFGPDLARAWLLAILKAKQAERRG
jgi:hypothetical protein